MHIEHGIGTSSTYNITLYLLRLLFVISSKISRAHTIYHLQFIFISRKAFSFPNSTLRDNILLKEKLNSATGYLLAIPSSVPLSCNFIMRNKLKNIPMNELLYLSPSLTELALFLHSSRSFEIVFFICSSANSFGLQCTHSKC